MLPLIYKDLYLSRKSLVNLAILGLVVGAVFSRTGVATTLFLAFAWIAVWNYAARIGYMEERNRTYGFLWTLPLPRREVVVSKFAGVLVVWGGSLALFCLAAKVFQLVGLTPANALPVRTAVLGSLHMLVLMGLFLYLALRWDYLRAVNGVRYLFLLFITPVLIPKQYLAPVGHWLEVVVRNPLAPAGAVVAVFGIYLGFMWLAERAFERKELQDVV